MKNEQQLVEPTHLQPLNDDLLANLSIEELEERLEMQILHLTEAQFCYDCNDYCNIQCTPNTCEAQCGQLCSGYCEECIGNCPELCTAY